MGITKGGGLSEHPRNQASQSGRDRTRVEMSKSLLERMGMTVEQYQRVVLNALVRVPALADCDNASLDLAVMRCITAGLLPDGDEAVIVPFKDRNKPAPVATLIPMVAGQIKMAKAATPTLALRVRAVYKDDTFDYSEGLRPVLDHRPNQLGSRRDDDIIAVYAVGMTSANAEPEFEVMWRADIDRYRAYSRSSGSGPWVSHYGEQAKKTVLKQLLKAHAQGRGRTASTACRGWKPMNWTALKTWWTHMRRRNRMMPNRLHRQQLGASATMPPLIKVAWACVRTGRHAHASQPANNWRSQRT